MGIQMTERLIALLCGQISYKKGKAFNKAGKVSFTKFDAESQVYEADVKESSVSRVSVHVEQSGRVHAECTCPSLSSYDKYCSHIAAVLLAIRDRKHAGTAPVRSGASRASADDLRLTDDVLELFDYKPMRPSGAGIVYDTRQPLKVSFTCKCLPLRDGKQFFAIEIKVGPKRLYTVRRIADFLDRVQRRETCALSKSFTYDPEVYCFQKEDDAVIRQLIRISQHDRMYRDHSEPYPVHAGLAGGESALPVPPVSWESLLPLLVQAPSTQLEHAGGCFDGIRISDEAIPVRFELGQAPTEEAPEYQMDVQGLENITVMESYEAVLTEGNLIRLPSDPCRRLSRLKRMLEASRTHRIRIPPERMEPVMEQVVPGLMKLGSVRIAQSVSDRMLQTQLQARLYLDRVKDRLLAALEFQYGDIVINPLESEAGRRNGPILMRDGNREGRILELMEQSSFARTESGYFMEDEEAEFEFLYRIVPQLEKLLQVYATSAVKIRLHTGYVPPKVTVDTDERTDWLEVRFDIDGIPPSEIRELLRSLEEKRTYYRLRNGTLLPLESAEFQEIARFINETGMARGDVHGNEFRLPIVRGLRLIDDPQQGRAVKLGKSFRRLLESMRNPDHSDFPVPQGLASVLREYQNEGYQWMKTLALYRFGGILADEMGLGKTVQSIAFIASVLPEIRSQGQPALVVAPASLVYNWLNELKKFAPDIRAVIPSGGSTERNRMLTNAVRTNSADVVITSYPLLRKDMKRYAEHSFHTLILDEAQFFKNRTTQTAQAVKRIQAKYRFALTGTPVENALEELWSIFDAVFPELFPDRQAFIELPRETVAKRIRPFLMRRLKSEVLKELPDKIESVQASELLPEQKKLYAAYLAKLQKETLRHLNEDSFDKNRIKILAGLTRLRQLCCHPALFVEGYAGGSAKLEQLLDIIEECLSAGKRMLIFSQFTEMLGIIRRELGYRGVQHFYLDGQTPASERVALCNRFNGGERELFLISLKAGGTGLNLTGADTVVLYDLWWNPAVEQQAADRAHRIGQKSVVQVIRLVAQGTVEDKMYELQQKKKNLVDEVIRPGQEALSSLTEQELRDILMI
ncbi:RNA polymerase-associated protein RapA [Paenibacillus sp. CECT 9249]|uniref:DEAD/DEAH box helicase n=1 Tax=Paenibacillus sp. CECT 9249 TaxID=2845385 RepID=UPI001E298A8C|nr:SNF2 helicase associated domain-containing protein [Paenibacillus sp. CECT 9249]CAH0120925.1 RNA polymerase-associated protein RapA [Paenibacillus sp. CECT 9249]